MISGTEIYWITRMDYVQGFALVVSVLLTICCMAGLITSCVIKYNGYSKEDRKQAKRAFRWFLPTSIISLILLFGAMLVPSTKEYCAIKAIPVIVNNQQVQELPNKVIELANEWIDELKSNKESE